MNASGGSLDCDVKHHGSPEHVELYDMLDDPSDTLNQAMITPFGTVKAELSAALAGGYGWSNAPVAVPATDPTNYAVWQNNLVEPG